MDQPADDGAQDDGAERHPARRAAADSGGANDGRAELAEPRSREEYWEELRAADGGRGSERSGWDAADSSDRPAPGHSGWDEVDSPDRPEPNQIRLSADRAGHILDGDPGGPGGGHRHGTGRPGKTEFPASWDDQKVLDMVLDVARRPDSPPVLQDFNSRWRARGTRHGVEIVVIVAGDGDIWTSWPLPGGAGVVRNPRRERL